MIILDTNVLVAFVHPRDQLHPQAASLIRMALGGAYGHVVSTDYVLDEGLTLLQQRTGRRELSERFAGMFHGITGSFEPQVQLRHTTPDVLEEAVELHLSHYDQKLSLTDCTLAVHARRSGASLATFDRGFQGVVPIVPLPTG